MVWEQQVHVIIMLTVGMENGRVSALQFPRITTRWHMSSSSPILGQVGKLRLGKGF